MQKITFLVLLAIVASPSAAMNCCGRSKENKKVQKNSQSKLKLTVNFGENEVEPESIVKILEVIGDINWQKVGKSFAPVNEPDAAPPTYVNTNGKQVSAKDLIDLLDVLNAVNWPQFSSSFANSGQRYTADIEHSSHGHEKPSGSNPGSQRLKIDGGDLDVAHVAQLLERMGQIDWRKVEKSIEAAYAVGGRKSNSPPFRQNELPHLAKILEKIGEIDWKKIESLVENSANQPNAGVNNDHGNAGKSATVSQPIQSALEELKQHEPKKTNSASVPQKNKKPQTNVQRLIEKWSVPPLVEQRHFHCQENCKHCQENIFYGEEVSAPHITKKLNRLGSVDWNTVGSKSSDNKQ